MRLSRLSLLCPRARCACRRVAPAVPSPLLSRRVALSCRVALSVRVALPVPSRLPVLSGRVALPLPVASRPSSLAVSRPTLHGSLWAHASGDLPKPDDPAPLGADPSSANRDRYARQRADQTAWKSRDAAACIALSSLLPEYEEAHFTQVRTASEFLIAIKARYATPTTVSLGRLFLPFLFPDLASFECSADLIAHLCSLDSSYRAACTDAQLALLPPPMAITIYFIATSLHDRLASVPAVMTSSWSRGRSGGRGVQGAGGSGEGGVASDGDGSTEVGGATRAAASDSPAAAGGGDARVR
ncbi:unnamed protein product [Closterium sp. NIES-54]